MRLEPNRPEVHPLVWQFFMLQQGHGVSQRRIGETAGISRSTMLAWRRRNAPTIATFEAALNVLGYRLAIEPIPESKT